VPFSFQPAQTAMPEGPYGPVVRTGADVIDLAAMISQMESGRKTGGGQR